jgi:hypothetical protein
MRFRLGEGHMQKFSQQGQCHAPDMVSATYVEHFIRRMRAVSQGDSRMLSWLEEIISETEYPATLECSQNAVAYQKSFDNPRPILPILIISSEPFSPARQHRGIAI